MKEEEIKLSESEVKQKKEFDDYVEKKLSESKFNETENTYSFDFDGQLFEFRVPTILEKTRIKAILASITRYPGSPPTVSSGYDIYSSGDYDLMYSTTVITHTAVLMNIPNKFDIESFGDSKIYDLGELITLAESKFNEDKKKPSTEQQ